MRKPTFSSSKIGISVNPAASPGAVVLAEPLSATTLDVLLEAVLDVLLAVLVVLVAALDVLLAVLAVLVALLVVEPVVAF